MYSYENIVKANQTIKTVNIQGKDYAEVHERIKAFRSICPSGRIETTLISNENGVCVFKAAVYDEEGKLLGTGTAYEKEGNSFINKTSYLENCETSAIGRALGICGIGIGSSIASADEILNAHSTAREKETKENVEQNFKKAELLDAIDLIDASYVKKMIANKGVKQPIDLSLDYIQKCYDYLKNKSEGTK